MHLPHWQKEDYLRSALRRGLGPDSATVRVHESLTNRESQARSTWPSRRCAAAEELLKYAVQFLFLNSPSVIGDTNLQLPIIHSGIDFDRSINWRVLQRIIG